MAVWRDVVSTRGVAEAAPTDAGTDSAAVRFATKWPLALTLLRQVRAAGFSVTIVLGDAEFGDNTTLRRTLYRGKLPYALGVSFDLTVLLGTRIGHPFFGGFHGPSQRVGPSRFPGRFQQPETVVSGHVWPAWTCAHCRSTARRDTD